MGATSPSSSLAGSGAYISGEPVLAASAISSADGSVATVRRKHNTPVKTRFARVIQPSSTRVGHTSCLRLRLRVSAPRDYTPPRLRPRRTFGVKREFHDGLHRYSGSPVTAREVFAQPLKLFRRGAPSALARFAGQTKLRARPASFLD